MKGISIKILFIGMTLFLVSCLFQIPQAFGESGELRSLLISEAPEEELVSTWEKLWEDIDTGEKASRAIYLIESLFPNGDVSRWEEVSGFWYPSLIPKSLAALDAVYVLALSLAEIGEPDGKALAAEILKDLSRSRKGRIYAFMTAPEEYLVIQDSLKDIKGLSLPEGKIIGSLPFAHPVRGRYSVTTGNLTQYVSLNGFGQPVSTMGAYGWDREKGRIFAHIERESNR